ncbi:MAG: LysR substrate-binding domain-containing protein, partial [Pseudomonadota bacterium]
GHPLARHSTVRLRDCLAYPLCLPSIQYGVRQLLNQTMARRGETLAPVLQSDSFEFLRHTVRDNEQITFQIEVGLKVDRDDGSYIHRPIDQRDLPGGTLHLSQLRGRVLPVAAARFADQLVTVFQDRFQCL